MKWFFPLFLFRVYAMAVPQAILTDIEGTTTSISFVQDILFAYAKTHVRSYVIDNQSNPEVTQIIQEVKKITEMPNADLEQTISTLLLWMEQDKKITPLKTLQGMMWKEGYEQAAFQGHVYKDAYQALNRWHHEGIQLYVYSSGSVSAQKLLFSHALHGDMTPLFSGYFDTKVGGKRESISYRMIASEIGLSPEKILFLSDTIEELNAAREVGMQTRLLLREGSAMPTGCSHKSATTFDEIYFQ